MNHERPLLAMLGLALLGGAGILWCRQGDNGGGRGPEAENVRLPAVVDDISLESHAGGAVTLSSFRGTPWIAGFLFTRCGGPCPRVMAALAALSTELEKEGVRCAAFTVDPDHDTPEVLARYAGMYRLGRGFLLLTADKAAMYRLIQEGFKLGVARAEGAEAEKHLITHSQRLLLMDRGGAIRGYYDALDPDAMKRLARAARVLAE